MRVGVVGAGVVGSYFGGRLAHAGQNVVFLAVKGWQVPGVIETMRPLMGASTFAVTLSDGIEVPDQVAAAFGTNRVVDGIALMLGTSVAPAHIRNTLLRTSIALGELDSSH